MTTQRQGKRQPDAPTKASIVARDAKTGQFASVREARRGYAGEKPRARDQLEIARALIERDKDILAALAK